MQNGVCSGRTTLAHRTAANASGLLATLTTVGNELSPSMMKWASHRRLAEFLSEPLPTPTAKTYGYNKGGAAGRSGKERPSLETITKSASGGRCTLSIREWMMGWPIGWTGSAPLETDRYREWQQWHGKR